MPEESSKSMASPSAEADLAASVPVAAVTTEPATSDSDSVLFSISGGNIEHFSLPLVDLDRMEALGVHDNSANHINLAWDFTCLLYTSPSPRD